MSRVALVGNLADPAWAGPMVRQPGTAQTARSRYCPAVWPRGLPAFPPLPRPLTRRPNHARDALRRAIGRISRAKRRPARTTARYGRRFPFARDLPSMRPQASELSPAFCVLATRRSRALGSFSGRVLLGHRPVVSSWPVPGAEFLEPDDLDKTLRLVARYGDMCNLFDLPGTGFAEPDEDRARVLDHLTELAGLGISHAIVSPRRPWDAATLDRVAAMVPDVHAIPSGG